VREETRSLVLGFITGAGSLGALLSAPIGQTLSVAFGWRAEVLGFFALPLAMLPAAWFAGNVDKARCLVQVWIELKCRRRLRCRPRWAPCRS
jgi:MFS family permease